MSELHVLALKLHPSGDVLDSRGNGVSGAHNRFTHYPCPIMKAIETNSGSTGVVSNMVPSLQHVYTVSILIGKVEYVPRKNAYDKSEQRQTCEPFFYIVDHLTLLFLRYNRSGTGREMESSSTDGQSSISLFSYDN